MTGDYRGFGVHKTDKEWFVINIPRTQDGIVTLSELKADNSVVARATMYKCHWYFIGDILAVKINNDRDHGVPKGKWACKPIPISGLWGPSICVLFWAMQNRLYSNDVNTIFHNWTNSNPSTIYKLYDAVMECGCGEAHDKDSQPRRAIGVWLSQDE